MNVIARVKALPINTEIVVVDDCSTDGTRGWLETIKGATGLTLIFKDKNEGKGAALKSGFAAAKGEIIVVQDADLEYDPNDILHVIRPLIEGTADVAYGSRFLGDVPQDPSLFHRFVNRSLTELSNYLTGLRLTDMETCYKAFRKGVLRTIDLRQQRFGFEPEVTAKVARQRYRIVEMPVSYSARGYAEGKKIGVRDAFNALYCIIRYAIAD
jgi:glycosyltransferase involved in cell wall biosynthesis